MNFIEPDTLPDELRDSITYRNLKEGERLFRQGDTGNNLYAIASGRIRLIHHLDGGEFITLQFLDSGKLLGEDALHEGVYTYTAIAQIPTKYYGLSSRCVASYFIIVA